MQDKSKIVLVEDDAVIAELIQFNLTSEGFEVLSYRSGASMFERLGEAYGVCLFILDIMLPGMDGFEICRKLRERDDLSLVPIMMLTARATESDKVKGLEAGADDYVTKPFGIREFLARVQAHVRRYEKSIQALSSSTTQPDKSESAKSVNNTQSEPTVRPPTYSGTMEYAGILLDDVRHRVFSDGIEIEMTNREYELLKFLMQNRGVAYSRDDLLNHVWGYEYTGETRTVDVHIRQLRRKIEKDDANPVIIETVRGRGYRFCEK